MNESNLRKRGPRQLKRTSPHRSDFCFGRTLGEGSYAKVVHCTSKHDNTQEFAIKIMAKDKIKNENKIKHVMLERQLLAELSSPYVIKLVLSFHDIDNLFICMEYVSGGDLRQFIDSYYPQESEGERIQAKDSSWISITQFYIAELVEALEYVHSQGVIHRDIKPENVLITASGHIKLGDFGSALLVHGAHASAAEKEIKEQQEGDHKAVKEGHTESFRVDISPQHSFMGTSEYVSPEVLRDQEATRSSDYWALGCIVFKMHTSVSPFMAGTEFLIFQKILAHADGIEPSPIKYPDSMGAGAVDLVASLLHRPSLMRFGEKVEFGSEEVSILPIAANESPVQSRLAALLMTDADAGPIGLSVDSGRTATPSDGPGKIIIDSSFSPVDQDVEVVASDTDRCRTVADPLAEAITDIDSDVADSSVIIAPTSICCSSNDVSHPVRDSRPSSPLLGGSVMPEIDPRDLHRSIKKHVFFHGIVWGSLLEGQVPVPSWPAHESVRGLSLYGGDYAGFMFNNKHSLTSARSGDPNAP